METSTINFSDLVKAVKADLGISKVKVTVKRIEPCAMRHDDGLCVKLGRGYQVYINEYIHDDERIISLVAHELRHVWQYENGFPMTLADTYASRAVYVTAPEEVDANTYAERIVDCYAGYNVCLWK